MQLEIRQHDDIKWIYKDKFVQANRGYHTNEQFDIFYKGLIEILENALNCAKATYQVGLHNSDCAVYNEPAYPAGSCNCK